MLRPLPLSVTICPGLADAWLASPAHVPLSAVPVIEVKPT